MRYINLHFTYLLSSHTLSRLQSRVDAVMTGKLQHVCTCT